MSVDTLMAVWLQISALTIASWITCRCFKNARSVQLICKTCLLMVFGLLVLSAIPRFPSAAVAPVAVTVQQSVVKLSHFDAKPAPVAPTREMLSQVAPSRPAPVDYSTWIIPVWILGSGFLALVLLAGLLKLVGIRATSKQAGSYAGIPLRTSDAVSSPFVQGAFRPTIYVPTNWKNTHDEECRTAILEHEAGHVAGRDLFWMSCYRLGTILLWPAVGLWALQRTFHVACEHVCDDRVLRSGYAERSYAQCLLHLKSSNPLPLAAGAVGRRSNFSRRITAIMSGKRLNPLSYVGKLSLTSSVAIIGAVSFLAIGTAVAAPLVFSEGQQVPLVPGEIRFVGVVDFASGQTWDRDGNLLGKYKDWLGRPAPGRQGLGALVEVFDTTKSIKYKTANGTYIDSSYPAARSKMNGQSSGFAIIQPKDNGSKWQCIQPLTGEVAKGSELGDFQYGVATGQGKVIYIVKFGKDGSFTPKSGIESVTDDSSKYFKNVVAGALADQKKYPTIYFESSFVDSDAIDLRFQAFDRSGRILQSAGWMTLDAKKSRIYAFRGRLSDLGRLEIRSRDFKWFTVPRIALQPVAQLAESVLTQKSSESPLPKLLGVVQLPSGKSWDKSGKPIFGLTNRFLLRDPGTYAVFDSGKLNPQRIDPEFRARVGSRPSRILHSELDEKTNEWISLVRLDDVTHGADETGVSLGIANRPWLISISSHGSPKELANRKAGFISVKDPAGKGEHFDVVTVFRAYSDTVDLAVKAFDKKGEPFEFEMSGPSKQNHTLSYAFKGNLADLGTLTMMSRPISWGSVETVPLQPNEEGSR